MSKLEKIKVEESLVKTYQHLITKLHANKTKKIKSLL